MAQERLQATIPANNKWHTVDLTEKAVALGMDKGEFVLGAVDFLMNFDETVYKKAKKMADGLEIPLWLYIQNKLIKESAQIAAKVEAGTWHTELLDEFMSVSEISETGETKKRMLTGEELFNNLKYTYLDQEKAKAREAKRFIKNLGGGEHNDEK